MADSVIPFPAPRFAPADVAELRRWTREASAIAHWAVWQDLETGEMVGRTPSGVEFVSLAQGQPWDGCAYTVSPHRGRWALDDARLGHVGTFGSLREALEAVCRTRSTT